MAVMCGSLDCRMYQVGVSEEAQGSTLRSGEKGSFAVSAVVPGHSSEEPVYMLTLNIRDSSHQYYHHGSQLPRSL